MTRKPLWPIIRRLWITLGLAATVVFVGWSAVAYRANDEARGAIVSDDRVRITRVDGVWRFTPSTTSDSLAFVFFPGSLVDPVAYAPLLRAVAATGHRAFMVELPRRGAFGGGRDPALRARLLALLHSESVGRWVAGGHSLGGVVASQVAADGVEGLAGLVLVGTSHPRDVDLSALAVPVSKIVGTHDGLASREEVLRNARLLPPTTRWTWVEGGNHSQFGWYGFQPGDRFASTDAGAQRRAMIAATIELLDSLGARVR